MICEVFSTLIADKYVERRDLRLGIDLLAKDLKKELVVIRPDEAISDFVLELLNEHPDLTAVKISGRIFIRRKGE
jgi:hypothetical protein